MKAQKSNVENLPGPYSRPRRKPEGGPVALPIEATPLTLQEQLHQMVQKELRFRDLQRKTAQGGPDDGLDDVDILGDDDDSVDIELTQAEVDFMMAQLETAAKVREKLQAKNPKAPPPSKPTPSGAPLAETPVTHPGGAPGTA